MLTIFGPSAECIIFSNADAFKRGAEIHRDNAEVVEAALESVRSQMTAKKTLELERAEEALEFERVFRLRIAEEMQAYGEVLEKHPTAEKAHQEMLKDISPTTNWARHDGNYFCAQPGIRLLDSKIPVYPIYMGSQDHSPEYAGVTAIEMRNVYENQNDGFPHRFVTGGASRNRPDLVEVIRAWGRQFATPVGA